MNDLNRVYPDMAHDQKMQLCKKIGQQFARSWSEIMFNDRYKKHAELFHADQKSLQLLTKAQAQGKGVIYFQDILDNLKRYGTT